MVEELTPEEVNERVQNGDIRVIDTRPQEQYERGHIPGAINVPLGDLPSMVPDIDWDDRDVVCACPVGQSSKQAAMLISSYEGVEEDIVVASMSGGYEEWDFELETDASADA
ncbi:sulfurtransferase [Halorubrum sp. Ib24]|uniref:rhodanese-like domain-containing protein n=1 Tax=unclassified Halorubrum TaxID=2642239 RepID=UPI000B99C7C8|nr:MULTISPECIES: rhodanese-like domain-containing protein [unclassified Halorubrum]OYR38242.1 sulfurtransferase [Halorubrum sp. Hd13]OYR39420.1 sulfurtransferase [Halorubrum sp. Eb13]OYR41258.1 sulfurtransferase [Halorubrum sp. Ib24]OYR50102.1 sulfurtransferase [Halorubrum sp. Ea8]OYR53229.1 sulfurtransferase [Halorubrum sp. Ea1]